MALDIQSTTLDDESAWATRFLAQLQKSEPRLSAEGVRGDVYTSLPCSTEIDIVFVFEDLRKGAEPFLTSDKTEVRSFVLALEVKKHCNNGIRFEGPKALVRYGEKWHNATQQSDKQKYGLRDFLLTSLRSNDRRRSPFIQNAIWFPNAQACAFDRVPKQHKAPVHFNDLSWQQLIDAMTPKFRGGPIDTLIPEGEGTGYHSFESVKELLGHQVCATVLDKKKLSRLSKKRFDVEKQQYIDNLGTGVLEFRGRGGTGKTFTLLQLAFYLAREGKRSLLLTFNHGLLSDINRTIELAVKDGLPHELRPVIQTRYSFIREYYESVFGEAADARLRDAVPDLDARESARLSGLLLDEGVDHATPDFDYALIDEGQDWSIQQRDLVYRVFGAERTIVTDGVDQFVSRNRVTWDDVGIPKNKVVPLRVSRRTKPATCTVIGHVADALGLDDWDLEPDPEIFGGRLTVFVEPDGRAAIKRMLDYLDADLEANKDVEPIDNLICLPGKNVHPGFGYPTLFDREIERRGWGAWRGFDDKDRRNYPIREDQLRAVLYQSSRGMEGWICGCLALDRFFDWEMDHPGIDRKRIVDRLRAERGFSFDAKEAEQHIHEAARRAAARWTMIPLTRSVDHLIVHLSREDSILGKAFRQVETALPDHVTWK